MKRFPPPLRYSIPATLLILGGLLGVYSFQEEIALASLRNQEKAIDYARFVGDRTSGILAYLYRRADGSGADIIISQLQEETYLQVGILLDENNQVVLSTQRGLQNLPLTDTLAPDELAKVENVRQTLAGRVSLSSDRNSVQAVYPVPLPAAPGEVISSRVGVLFLEYDQLTTLRQQAYRDAMRRSLEFSLVLSLSCVAAWYFFDKILTLRASRLVEVSNRLSEGDLSVRAELSGSDELARISNAFDRMAQLVQSRTEALQNSQASLTQAHTDVSRQAEQLGQTLKELQSTQSQLIQTEKMSSLGQLVAGVAHEINNPVNFIHGNLFPIADYVRDLLTLIELYQKELPHPSPKVQNLIADIDLEFITEDLHKTLSSMRSGTERIRQIVLTLRNFSRLDESEMKAVNIHEGLDSTLVILQHRLKPKADKPKIQIIKDYGDLPKVECYVGQLNQVFMNILNNAIDALEEKISKQSWLINQQQDAIDHQLPMADYPLPTIRIQTKALSSNCVAIHIADNGPGIPEDMQRRLFDPFFTTKPVGKGTGLGMSISYQIVAEKHRGSLYCISTPQQGAEFVIEIPIRQQK